MKQMQRADIHFTQLSCTTWWIRIHINGELGPLMTDGVKIDLSHHLEVLEVLGMRSIFTPPCLRPTCQNCDHLAQIFPSTRVEVGPGQTLHYFLRDQRPSLQQHSEQTSWFDTSVGVSLMTYQRCTNNLKINFLGVTRFKYSEFTFWTN